MQCLLHAYCVPVWNLAILGQSMGFAGPESGSMDFSMGFFIDGSVDPTQFGFASFKASSD
jgi:hypothetical protein